MSNVLEALKHLVVSYVDHDTKPPMHVGEVMACWTYLAMLNEAVSYEEAALHMTGDEELLGAVRDGIKMCSSQSKRLSSFMTREGIPLPPGPEQKPQSIPSAVPLGVKLTDNEISNGMSVKVAGAIVAAASGAAQSIRNDIGILWVEFQAEQMVYGTTLKAIMRKRGWLKIPPAYIPPGSPQKYTDRG